MKKILILFFTFFSVISYSGTRWDTTSKNPIVIVYKVLDPLIVTVDPPKRIVVPFGKDSFKYSEYNGNNKIKIKVETGYNTGEIDFILRKIYERVNFKLKDNGIFNLYKVGEENKKAIIGEGYFVDNEARSNDLDRKKHIIKNFSNNVSGDKFSAQTEIDVDFRYREKDKDPPAMGVYKGTLVLDVWFDGSIGGNN